VQPAAAPASQQAKLALQRAQLDPQLALLALPPALHLQVALLVEQMLLWKLLVLPCCCQMKAVALVYWWLHRCCCCWLLLLLHQLVQDTPARWDNKTLQC
jgi:hypothetical protein